MLPPPPPQKRGSHSHNLADQAEGEEVTPEVTVQTPSEEAGPETEDSPEDVVQPPREYKTGKKSTVKKMSAVFGKMRRGRASTSEADQAEGEEVAQEVTVQTPSEEAGPEPENSPEDVVTGQDRHGMKKHGSSDLLGRLPSFKDLSFKKNKKKTHIMHMEEQARVSKFHSFVMKGDLAAISTALDDGYDVNCVDRWNRNGVMYASMCNNEDVLQLFRKQDIYMTAAVNAKDIDGKTSAHWACECTYIQLDCVRFLAGIGADFNVEDDEGQTPAYKALTANNNNVVLNLLFQLGADANWKDKDGKGYLDYCDERVTALGTIIAAQDVKKTCKRHMKSQNGGSSQNASRQGSRRASSEDLTALAAAEGGEEA
uniref:Uncharacterized protein n=1 Tax=Heterosigma akashiwo TaxID=2829 RepID=A0A6V1PG27_HETAK